MDGSHNVIGQKSSVWTEYSQKGANAVLYGLSFFFSVPQADSKHEVKVLEGLSIDQSRIGGEMDVSRICTVVQTAMAPLKTMFVKGLVVSAVCFFAGRALSILPFVPALCYLTGLATLLVTHDIYRAGQQMKYTFTHFNMMLQSGSDRVNAESAARVIDTHAQQSLCDMLLFGQDDQTPTFKEHAKKEIEAGQESLDPYVVTQIFFPALTTIRKVTQMAKAYTPSGEDEHKE